MSIPVHPETADKHIKMANLAAEGAWHLLDDNPNGLITIGGPAPATPRWVFDAWKRALERRGVFEMAPETASEV